MLLLMYSMSLNIVRQALAIAVVFYSLKFIQQKKPLYTLSNQYLYIQAKNHVNFFEDFVKDYDLKDITHLQIEDELFDIYATKLIDSNVIDIFVKAKYYDISIHKQITKE